MARKCTHNPKHPRIDVVATDCGTGSAYLHFDRLNHLCPLSLIARFDDISRQRTACQDCESEDHHHQNVSSPNCGSTHVPSHSLGRPPHGSKTSQTYLKFATKQ